jgi:probable HAF family extracellular repeat protein
MNAALPGMPKGAKPMAKAAVITIGATLIGVLLVFSASLQAQQVPCSYSVQILPEVDCGIWQAAGNPTGINNLGNVVGIFGQCGSQGSTDSFIWIGGDDLTIIQRPIGVLSFSATDINDEGLITGTAETSNAGQRGFIYNSKTDEWTQLPPPNPASQGWSSAESINSKGQVCGYRSVNDGGDPVNPWMAYIWTPGAGFTDLGLINGETTAGRRINEAGHVIGTMYVNGVSHAFLWHDGKITDLGTLAGLNTTPLELNDKGTVVGVSRISNGPPIQNRAFRWNDNQITNLGILPGFNSSSANGVTNSGLITGRCSNSTADGIPVIWVNGRMIVFNDLIPEQFNTTANVLEVINENGQIVAFGHGPRGTSAFLLTPTGVSEADLVINCQVDVDDLLKVIYEWGNTESIADLDGDGVVDVDDLMIVIEEWTF